MQTSKGIVTRRYVCPECHDQVELAMAYNHACTPRCTRCKLLMVSAWELSLGRRKRHRSSRWARLIARSAG